MDSLSRFSSSSCSGILSIDRCTFLVYSPRLSLWGKDSEHNERYVKRMAYLTETLLKHELDPDFCNGVSSELFKKHYRTSAGVDIQFGAFMPRRKKLDSLLYVQSFGSQEQDEDASFVFCYLPNEYAFRVEYNPNNSDLSSVLPLLQNFAGSRITSSEVRIARLDIAIDYSADVNPALAMCDRMRKSFIASGPSGIETIYFGSRSSQYYIRLYNKALELREKQHIDSPGPLWRFELESKKSFSLSDLPDFGKVLQRFSFFSAGVRSGDWKLDLILAYAKENGLKSALAFLPPATKKRYSKYLSDYDRTFIEPPADVYFRDFPFRWKALKFQILSALGHNFFDDLKDSCDEKQPR